MDDRHAGGQFAASYPPSNTNPPLQSAQQYPYSATNPANNSAASRPHPHQQQSKAFHTPVGDQPQQQHMSLPSIQHFESHNGMQSHPQPAPQSHPQPAAQSHPHQSSYAPPPPYPPPQFHQYPQNGAHQAPMQASIPPNNQNGGGIMRYPIPLQQHTSLSTRQLVDARHKKEIKRRTKTGCLTCRKRRIKCDEGHPTCRNCQKSKRDCLGYDPIFKQQPGPANIQPAPMGNGAPASNNHYSNTDSPPDAASNNTAATSTTNPYPPQSYQSGTGGRFVPTPGASQGTDGHFEYGHPLDPALAAGDNSHAMAQNHYSHALQAQRKVKRVSIEELFSLNDISPRYNQHELPPSVSTLAREEVESFYRYHYATGLDRLFDTTWYGTQGLNCLLSNDSLLDFVIQCTERFKAKTEDKAILSLEARLVWQLATMPRNADANSTDSVSKSLVQELLPRIDIVENLLTGQFLESTKVPPAAESPSEPMSQKQTELAFWHHLGRFVSLHDDAAGTSTMKDINDVLSELRGLLSMVENRDVLYSVAVIRHTGGRMPEFHPHRQLVASTPDSNDDVTKLRVAQLFLEQEDSRGTTQVIQRMCSMAIRGSVLQKQ